MATALQVMDDAEDPLRGREYTVASLAVLEYAAKSSCSANDCEFVSCAGIGDFPRDLRRAGPSGFSGDNPPSRCVMPQHRVCETLWFSRSALKTQFLG